MRAKQAAGRAHGASNRVRIIGGQYRRRLLDFPDSAGLRPTPDRVRETVFNWLGQDLPGFACLDLFAGSGALGFEAASRGAARVVMVERDRAALGALEKNRATLGAEHVEIVHADALAWIAASREAFDVVFVDPPFDSGLASVALPSVVERLQPGGVIYVEQGTEVEPPRGFIIHRQGRAGRSHFALLVRE